MKNFPKAILGFSGLVLVAAGAAVIWLGGGDESRTSPFGRLADLLPAEIHGVKVEDIPLGPNEAVDGAAKEKMDYDDVIHRSYTSGRGTFTVYVGYWARGRRSPSHVAAHIPDRCWTLAGMACLKRQEDYHLSFQGPALAPGYWRRFKQPNGLELETVFWHVVGDRFYDYGTRLHDYTPPQKRVADVIRDLFIWRTDQYFVRIVSTTPIAELANDAAFNAVMARVNRLGLIKQ